MPFQPGGSFPPSLLPSQSQTILNSNYMAFNTGVGGDFAQQYLPELYEQEVERYGNRTLNGFLRMVGAEMPMTSDQVIWSEQNRLHVAYNNVAAAALTLTITLPGGAGHALKAGQTILISDNATGLITQRCYIDTTPGGAPTTCTVIPYDAVALNAAFTAVGAVLSIFVYGSEWE